MKTAIPIFLLKRFKISKNKIRNLGKLFRIYNKKMAKKAIAPSNKVDN